MLAFIGGTLFIVSQRYVDIIFMNTFGLFNCCRTQKGTFSFVHKSALRPDTYTIYFMKALVWLLLFPM